MSDVGPEFGGRAILFQTYGNVSMARERSPDNVRSLRYVSNKCDYYRMTCQRIRGSAGVRIHIYRL